MNERTRPMRPLFLSIALLGFMVLSGGCPSSGGGGGGGGNNNGGTSQAGLSGDWNYTATTNNTCFGDPGYEEQDTATISVSGNSITIQTLSLELTGTINGSTITVTGSDTLFDHDMTLHVSSSGNSITGTDNWGFFFGPACFGSSNINLNR